MRVKSKTEVAQSCPTLSDPMDCKAAVQAPPSMGVSRQEYWIVLDTTFIFVVVISGVSS